MPMITGKVHGLVTLNGQPVQGIALTNDLYGPNQPVFTRDNGAYLSFLPEGTYIFSIYASYPDVIYEQRTIYVPPGAIVLENWTY